MRLEGEDGMPSGVHLPSFEEKENRYLAYRRNGRLFV